MKARPETRGPRGAPLISGGRERKQPGLVDGAVRLARFFLFFVFVFAFCFPAAGGAGFRAKSGRARVSVVSRR